jgi:hypothetical protein
MNLKTNFGSCSAVGGGITSLSFLHDKKTVAIVKRSNANVVFFMVA